jgi:methyl-accepting chemotaxis protein
MSEHWINAATAVSAIPDTISSSVWLTIISACVAFAGGLLLAWLIGGTIARAVEQLDDAMKELATGPAWHYQAGMLETLARNFEGRAGAIAGGLTNAVQDIEQAIEDARPADNAATMAAEMKSLANQTAGATEEIGRQIMQIRTVTKDVASSIDCIGSTITGINEIAASIAAVMEQQGAATQEVVHAIQQAVPGTKQGTRNIGGVIHGAEVAGKAA